MRRLKTCFLLLSLVPVWSEQIPKTAGESLTGEKIVLPDSIKGHTSVVIVGFS